MKTQTFKNRGATLKNYTYLVKWIEDDITEPITDEALRKGNLFADRQGKRIIKPNFTGPSLLQCKPEVIGQILKMEVQE